MKTAFVFLCAIFGAMAAGVLIAEEQKLHHLHDQCQADPATYVDHELLHNLKDNLENPQVGAHMLCESVKVGLQKENGDLDLKVIESKIALSVSDNGKVQRLVKECAVQKKTPWETAINLFMCLDNDGVTYFHEF